jgi:4-hydroxy-4-methyl-2-oxoglutarate aldolase
VNSLNKSKVFLRVNRVEAALCEQAKAVTVSDLHEVMGPQGRACLMSSRMRPIRQGSRIVGPAVTAFCAAGDNLMMHRALYLAKPGDVLVVVCQSETSGAQWGDVAAQYARHKGLAGVVVHGCVRDIDVVGEMSFPVWATHIHPMHPDKAGGGFVNVPVVCDGVLVKPGDMIVADGDGVLVVPKATAPQAVEAALARMRAEEAVGARILKGEHVWDINGAAGNYGKLDLDEVDAAFDD